MTGKPAVIPREGLPTIRPHNSCRVKFGNSDTCAKWPNLPIRTDGNFWLCLKTEPPEQILEFRVIAEVVIPRVHVKENHLAQALVGSFLQQGKGLILVSNRQRDSGEVPTRQATCSNDSEKTATASTHVDGAAVLRAIERSAIHAGSKAALLQEGLP